MMLRTVLVTCLFATSAHAAGDAPYAGQQHRAISSLSEDDLRALDAGEGWGLAKPAELNGWPGPRHVLDLAAELDLEPEQSARIEAIFAAMNAEARQVGARLIEAEAALDAAFEAKNINDARLGRLLADAEAARSELRRVHLAAHLQTAPLLTRHQKMTYDRLRGYADGADHSGHGEHD